MMAAAVGLRLRRSLTSPILIATFQQNTNIVVNESKPKAIRSSGWKFCCLAGPRMGDYGFIYPITKGSPEYVALNLTPDDLLTYEGCDYNHWMIVMDIRYLRKPKKRVETYVQTAAKVLGSVEEANKKIYAVMYSGFQVEVSEEVAQQFKGLPGVLQVLPDSYIDPDNKEYGGDKYVNGTIIPRPPDRWKRAQPRLVRHPGSSSCMRPEIIQFISNKMEEYKLRRYGK